MMPSIRNYKFECPLYKTYSTLYYSKLSLSTDLLRVYSTLYQLKMKPRKYPFFLKSLKIFVERNRIYTMPCNGMNPICIQICKY
jgi:hypothetical protein